MKSVILVSILIIILSFFIACTSEDEEGDAGYTFCPYGIEDESIQDVEYVILADWMNGESGEMILYSRRNAIIDVELVIDSMEVMMNKIDYYNEYWVEYAFQASRTYHVELSINNGAYHGVFDITFPQNPNVIFPDWDGLEDAELFWTLDEDAMVQRLEIIYTRKGNYPGLASYVLLPSDRAFTLKAGSFEYHGENGGCKIGIKEQNWSVSSQILFIARTGQIHRYGSWAENQNDRLPRESITKSVHGNKIRLLPSWIRYSFGL